MMAKKGQKSPEDPLIGLKVYNYFRSGTTNKKAYTLQELLEHDEWGYSEHQLRKILKNLEEDGYITSWKNTSENNRKYYSRIIAKDPDAKISGGNIYEFVIHDLIEVLTRYVDETDKEVFLLSDFSQKREALNGFIGVSREDFPFFSDDQFEQLTLIWENFKDCRFTELKLQQDKEAEPYFVTQVRFTNEGFHLMCLKPQKSGASLNFLNLNDIFDVYPGKPFKMSKEDFHFITKELITLSDYQIKTLTEKQI